MPGGQLGKKGVSVGKLRQSVTVQTMPKAGTAERDIAGQPIAQWIDLAAQAFAKIETYDPSDRTQYISQVGQADVSHYVIMRATYPIDEKCRLIWQGNGGNVFLNVVKARPRAGDGNYLEIWCKQQKF